MSDNDNANPVTIEQTTGGVRIKLPTLVFVHLLSMLGVCGGTYGLIRPDRETAAADVVRLQQDVTTLQRAHSSIIDRLARIETNTDNIWEDLRERHTARPRNTTRP